VLLFSWQLLKSIFRKSLLSLSYEISYNKLKKNPEIFKELLMNEEANPANLPEPDEAIRFGPPSALYQLVIACNPYCAPCAKAHQAVETLYEKFPGRFSISVRFTLHTNSDIDNRVLAAKEIMKVAKTKPLEAVKDWYSLFDIEKFKQAHLTNGLDVNAAIEKHIVWGKKMAIKGTPTFFVNGRRLPEMYSWKDCTEILEFEIQK
jgi:protein-disulfide isomerase